MDVQYTAHCSYNGKASERVRKRARVRTLLLGGCARQTGDCFRFFPDFGFAGPGPDWRRMGVGGATVMAFWHEGVTAKLEERLSPLQTLSMG